MAPNRNNHGSPQNGPSDQLTVSDPDDYNAQRRLRQLHDARERFPEARREARERYDPDNERASDITEERFHEIVANALVDYLFEVEPVAHSAGPTADKDGNIDKIHPAWHDEPFAEAPNGDELTLEDVVDEGGQMPTEDGDKYIPLDELRARKAFRHANQFIARVGLGLQLDQSGLPIITGFDQSRDDAEIGVDNAQMSGDPPL